MRFVCRLERAIDTLFSGTISSLRMMSPLVHAGSDEAYARVLVAERHMEVTSIELEVALYHDASCHKPYHPHHPIQVTLGAVGAGGAPRSLDSVILSGSQIYRATLPWTENWESVRRPLADQANGVHGEDDCTKGCTSTSTDHR